MQQVKAGLLHEVKDVLPHRPDVHEVLDLWRGARDEKLVDDNAVQVFDTILFRSVHRMDQVHGVSVADMRSRKLVRVRRHPADIRQKIRGEQQNVHLFPPRRSAASSTTRRRRWMA